MSEALVGNVADKEQIKDATRKEKDRRKEEVADLKFILSTVQGKRFLWRLLEQCKTFESVFSPESMRMSYSAGRQDLGHYLMAEIMDAEPEAFIEMMKQKGD